MSISTSDLIRACKFVDDQHGQFRWSQLHFLLVVYEQPGKTQTQLALELDCTLAAVSRNVDVFGEKGSKRNGKITAQGYKFLRAVADPEDDRNKLVSLTPKGERFIENLIAKIGGN